MSGRTSMAHSHMYSRLSSHRYAGLAEEVFSSGHSVEDMPSLPLQHTSDVCGFLPELATELATAQTTQDEEVEQKQRHLHELKEKLKQENEGLKVVAACVCAANRAITVAQDRAARAGLRCQVLEVRLSGAVREREEVRRQLERVAEERERGERQREKYMNKMALYRERVAQAEKESEANKQLADIQAKKQQLEEKRAVYMHGEGLLILSGERQKQLQESIIAAEAECALVDEEEAQTKEEKRLSEQQVQRWKREVEVSRRRRQAQLTRLHRQVGEAQARHRQWSKQSDSLTNTISSLQKKLTAIIEP